MTAIVVGVIFIVVGLWGVVHWASDLLAVLRGLGPVSVLLGGIVAVVAGISSFRPPRTDSK